MPTWNWELPHWPKFKYNTDLLIQKERQFLLEMGKTCAFLKNLEENEYKQFIVEILSLEGEESSKIEGELLNRESLQSSIKKHFGLNPGKTKISDKESRMAKLLLDVYESYEKPLTDATLCQWHDILFQSESCTIECGTYRTHSEPMQIVSRRYDSPLVFFEAPPSKAVLKEMKAFISWFNTPNPTESILGRAAIVHLYFESIHPFEDGNGRIGRALVEKILSQALGRPILIAISIILEKRKKEYYAALGRCNHTLEVSHWVDFFADAILQAQKESIKLLHFLIEKAKMMTTLAQQLNPRQEKVLLRMFAAGIDGFKGELSAEKYIAITKASRATATRDLNELVLKGALVKTGELRHTRYHLNIKKYYPQ